MEKASVETIKNDAIIDIQVSGAFYRALQHVINHLVQYESEESLKAVIDKLNAGESSENFTPWEFAIETMIVLCAEIEAKARKQNAIELVDVDLIDTTTTAPPTNI